MVFAVWKAGDKLEFKRGVYSHYGIAVSDCEFIHVTEEGSNFTESLLMNLPSIFSLSSGSVSSNGAIRVAVERERLTPPCNGFDVKVDNDFDNICKPFPAELIVRRAVSKIGPWNYDIVNNNCEHFANWCRYGVELSQQWAYTHKGDNSVSVGLGSISAGPVKVRLPNFQASTEQTDTRKGFVYEAEVVGGQLGPANAKLGLGVSTTAHAGDGSIGAQLLGTGFSIGRETKVSLFGSSVGLKLW